MDLSIVTANSEIIAAVITLIIAGVVYILLDKLTKEAFPDLPKAQRMVILLALYFMFIS